jgi:hypothetical protein
MGENPVYPIFELQGYSFQNFSEILKIFETLSKINYFEDFFLQSLLLEKRF